MLLLNYFPFLNDPYLQDKFILGYDTEEFILQTYLISNLRISDEQTNKRLLNRFVTEVLNVMESSRSLLVEDVLCLNQRLRVLLSTNVPYIMYVEHIENVVMFTTEELKDYYSAIVVTFFEATCNYDVYCNMNIIDNTGLNNKSIDKETIYGIIVSVFSSYMNDIELLSTVREVLSVDDDIYDSGTSSVVYYKDNHIYIHGIPYQISNMVSLDVSILVNLVDKLNVSELQIAYHCISGRLKRSDISMFEYLVDSRYGTNYFMLNLSDINYKEVMPVTRRILDIIKGC